MSDSQVVVAAVSIGIFVATVAALLWYGPKAAMVVLLVAVIGLTLDRVSVFKRLDEVWEDTDKALVNSAAAVEAVEELRGWLVEFRAAQEMEETPTLSEDETAGQPRRAGDPQTQPIELPEPQGPPTEPVTEVAARQVRALMEEGAEMVERTYVVDGVQRTFRLRAVKEDA